MKRRTAAYLLLFALALGFALYCPIWGALSAGAFGLEGEVLLGSRPEAGDVLVAGRSTAALHLAWDAAYSPASGLTEARAGFSLRGASATAFAEVSAAPLPPAGWSQSWRADIEPEFENPALEYAYYSRVVPEGAGESLEFSVPAQQAAGSLPFTVELALGGEAYPLEVELPVAPGQTLDCVYECDGRYASLTVRPGAFYAAYQGLGSRGALCANAVRAGDWIYVLAANRAGDGGSWGLWRVPLFSSGVPDCARAEGVDAGLGSWDAVSLAAADGGARVLIASQGPDGVLITTVDAALGAVTGSAPAFGPLESGSGTPGRLSVNTLGGRPVLLAGNMAAVLRCEDGAYVPEAEFVLDAAPLPGGAEAEAVDALFSGGRLAVLYSVEERSGGEVYESWLYAVLGGGGCVYAEMLTDAVSARRYDLLALTDGEYSLRPAPVGLEVAP